MIEAGSSADGALVADLHLRHSVLFGAVTRQDGTAEIVHGHALLNAGDNVVVFSRPDTLGHPQGVLGVTFATHSTGRVSWFGGRGERLLSPGRYSSLVANVVGLTIAVVGAGIVVSGLVDAVDGGPDVFVLLADRCGRVGGRLGHVAGHDRAEADPDPRRVHHGHPRLGSRWRSPAPSRIC